ncbi:MAG: hypothetical protein U0K92_03250 [Treponema sp.]|nr:hypothetical protein [Treponema sp.]
MKITRRSPRLKIGNTTYTFGKNGVSRSTRIAKGIRIRTSANGKQSIGGSFLCWRWSQDLDELGRNKSSQEINRIREQRKNDLSLGLLFSHPIVFLDHLLRKKDDSSQRIQSQLSQNQISKNVNPVPLQPRVQDLNVFSTDVSIFKELNGTFTKVTEGKIFLEENKLIVKANVSKEISYKDVLDVYVKKEKVFISSKNRNIPLVMEIKNVETFMNELNRKIMAG